jgi:hypothetical protein
MFFIVEFIFQILLELLLQIVVELLFSLGWASIAEAANRKPVSNPLLAFIGYGLLGLMIGGVSLLLFPKLFVHQATLQIGYLIFSPFLAGYAMSLLAAWRKGKKLTRIKRDSFAYGFIFAFGVAFIRYAYGAK